MMLEMLKRLGRRQEKAFGLNIFESAAGSAAVPAMDVVLRSEGVRNVSSDRAGLLLVLLGGVR